MRANQLLEARQGSLWHGFKDPEYAIQALKNNKMEGRTPHRWWSDRWRRDDEEGYSNSYWMKGISTTRDPKYAATWGDIVFELDQAKIDQTHKILPINWGGTIALKRGGGSDPKKEAEEYVVTYRKPDTYMDPIDDDEPEWKEFNYQRWKSPEGKPLQPLTKYLIGIYTTDYYKDTIQELIDDGKDQYDWAQEEIANYNYIINHPLYKGELPSGKRRRRRRVSENIKNQVHELQPNTAGWINIKTGEYHGWKTSLAGDIDTHARYFYTNLDEFHLSEEEKEYVRANSRGQDGDPVIRKVASDNGWVRVIHKAYGDDDTNIQGENMREIARAARMIDRQDGIEELNFDVGGLASDSYHLAGRALQMFMKSGRVPRQDMMMEDEQAWAVGPQRSRAKYGYVQDSKDNALLWVDIKDLFNHTNPEQRLDPEDPTGGENKIGARVKYAMQHWQEGGAMDPAEVVWDDWRGAVSFQDGRHRLVAAYQMGQKYAPVVVPKENVDEFVANIQTKGQKMQESELNTQLDEAVSIRPQLEDLRGRIIKKLKPFVKGNRSYVPGQTVGKLRSTLSDIVSRSIHYVAKKHYGMEKDYDLDVKVRFTKEGEGDGAGVSYIKSEDAIVVTIRIHKSDLEKALQDSTTLAKLASQVAQWVSHETVHVYQRMQAKEKMSRRSGQMGKFAEPDIERMKEPPQRGTPRFWELYLSDRQEIEAHAAEAVVNLLYKYGVKEPGKAYAKFKNKRPPLGIEAIDKYWHYFGQKKESVKHQRVWRRFLKKVDQQFQQYLDTGDATV